MARGWVNKSKNDSSRDQQASKPSFCLLAMSVITPLRAVHVMIYLPKRCHAVRHRFSQTPALTHNNSSFCLLGGVERCFVKETN